MQQDTAYCRECNAIIIFIRTERGKSMPCEPNMVPYIEDENGPTRVLTKSGKLIRCELCGSTEECTGYGYLPHFSRCISREGRERMEGLRQSSKSGTSAPAASQKPQPRPQVREEPKVEQMCLFGVNDRPYRHPI